MAGKFKVDKNVPLPPVGDRRSSKYPWSQMAVGDSFEFSKEDKGSVANSAKSYSRRHPEYTFRVYGLRIWRIKTGE